MQRRDFCRMMAAAAAATAIPKAVQLSAQTADRPAAADAAAVPRGFDTLDRDYAQFCATAADQRIFYALVDGKIVSQKLDEATWRPTGMGDAPALPVPGGSWDGVPMVAPKNIPPQWNKALTADYERGLTSGIMQYPWQSETCIGDWHYNRALYDKPGEYGGYLPPREVILWLIDTVSKNGTFLLNIPGKPDGTIDSKEIAVLDGITAWMHSNSEAIYATRPWKVFGEGPNTIKAGSFQGTSVSRLSEKDIRFTSNKAGNVVYAITLGWPTTEIVVQSLGTNNATKAGKIQNVQLLGTDEKLQWKQTPDSLRLELPKQYRPKVDYAAALKVVFA